VSQRVWVSACRGRSREAEEAEGAIVADDRDAGDRLPVNYDPEKHRGMVGPIDESAEEYEFICDELAQSERGVIEIAVRRPRAD
jgi:hypothetical protein